MITVKVCYLDGLLLARNQIMDASNHLHRYCMLRFVPFLEFHALLWRWGQDQLLISLIIQIWGNTLELSKFECRFLQILLRRFVCFIHEQIISDKFVEFAVLGRLVFDKISNLGSVFAIGSELAQLLFCLYIRNQWCAWLSYVVPVDPCEKIVIFNLLWTITP